MSAVAERWEALCLPHVGVHLACAHHHAALGPAVGPLADCGHLEARVYVNAVSGKRQCRDCRLERYHGRVRRGEVRSRAARKTVQEPGRRGAILPPDELAQLRAQVACRGCGAVRRDRPAKATRSTTYIRHRKGCLVRAMELAEHRADRLRRGQSAAATRLRNASGAA